MILVVCHGKEELYMICKKIFYMDISGIRRKGLIHLEKKKQSCYDI